MFCQGDTLQQVQQDWLRTMRPAVLRTNIDLPRKESDIPVDIRDLKMEECIVSPIGSRLCAAFMEVYLSPSGFKAKEASFFVSGFHQIQAFHPLLEA